MSSDPAWRYVNIRRLSIYIEQSLNRGLRWVASEPNNEQTWAAVRLSASDFLHAAWRDGALAGSKQSDAFFVKCDRATMTQSDLDNGRLICLIGIAPVKPAEFVIIRIGQTTSEDTRPGHADSWPPHLP
jgi:phage tail sheath protein FI